MMAEGAIYRNVTNLTPLSIVSGRAADYAAWPRVNVSHMQPRL